jgi:hypothetical protein
MFVVPAVSKNCYLSKVKSKPLDSSKCLHLFLILQHRLEQVSPPFSLQFLSHRGTSPTLCNLTPAVLCLDWLERF